MSILTNEKTRPLLRKRTSFGGRGRKAKRLSIQELRHGAKQAKNNMNECVVVGDYDVGDHDLCYCDDNPDDNDEVGTHGDDYHDDNDNDNDDDDDDGNDDDDDDDNTDGIDNADDNNDNDDDDDDDDNDGGSVEMSPPSYWIDSNDEGAECSSNASDCDAEYSYPPSDDDLIDDDDKDYDDDEYDKEERNHAKKDAEDDWPMEEVVSSLEPLKLFLGTLLGGSLDKTRVTGIVNRVSILLCWAAAFLYVNIIVDNTPLQFLGTFISKHYMLLEKFSTYLATRSALAPSTILNYLNDISKGFKWYCFFYDHGGETNNANGVPFSSLMQPINAVLTALRSNINGAVKKQRSKKTVEREVLLGRMPATGGIGYLQSVVHKNMEAFMNFTASMITEITYNSFLGLLFAAIYTSRGQGRKGGIESLRFYHMRQILRYNYGVTDQFKTSFKFGYQLMVLSGDSKSVFKLYADLFRPFIVERLNLITTDQSPLWLNWDGSAVKKISTLVPNFFSEKTKLHITTTTLRAMIEMKAEDMFNDGSITLGERKAIANTSGHCYTSTVKNYYLLQDRLRDAQIGDRMFPSAGTESTETLESCSSYKPIEWGELHPCSKKKIKPTSRFVWSTAELDYIKDAADAIKKVQGNSPKRLYSQVLRKIQEDPEAHRIFHQHHVKNSDRIKGGFENIAKAQAND